MQHRLEILYVATEVNTPQVDGLARIPPGVPLIERAMRPEWIYSQGFYFEPRLGLEVDLRKRYTSRILSHRIASRDSPRLISLSTNTHGSPVP